jgi:hypothetical protein
MEIGSVLVMSGMVHVRYGSRSAVQGLRGAFAKDLAVLNRKSSQFDEAKAGRNLRYRREMTVSRYQGASCLLEAQHSQMAAGR